MQTRAPSRGLWRREEWGASPLSGAEIKNFPGTKRPVLAQQLALNIFLFEQNAAAFHRILEVTVGVSMNPLNVLESLKSA